MSDFALTEKQYTEVLRLVRVYHREAHRCKDGKAYLAGCILMGAALEASLLAFVDCYLDEALCSPIVPTERGITKPLARWSLAELLAVVKERGWLPASLYLDEEWNRKKAQIGDWAEVLRQIRNLIHPVRHMLDLPRKRITKRYLETAFEIFEVATDYLLDKYGESLRIAFKVDKEDGDTS